MSCLGADNDGRRDVSPAATPSAAQAPPDQPGDGHGSNEPRRKKQKTAAWPTGGGDVPLPDDELQSIILGTDLMDIDIDDLLDQDEELEGVAMAAALRALPEASAASARTADVPRKQLAITCRQAAARNGIASQRAVTHPAATPSRPPSRPRHVPCRVPRRVPRRIPRRGPRNGTFRGGTAAQRGQKRKHNTSTRVQRLRQGTRDELEGPYQFCARASRRQAPSYVSTLTELYALIGNYEQASDIPDWTREDALDIVIGLITTSLLPKRLRRNHSKRCVRLRSCAETIRRVQNNGN